jgi:hypothetical protein
VQLTQNLQMNINKKMSNFPGGSKTRVNSAGQNVRSASASLEDLMIIEE